MNENYQCVITGVTEVRELKQETGTISVSLEDAAVLGLKEGDAMSDDQHARYFKMLMDRMRARATVP